MMLMPIKFDDWAELRIAHQVVARLNKVNPGSPVVCDVTSWSEDAEGVILEARPVYADLTSSSHCRLQHFFDELNAGVAMRREVEAIKPKRVTPHPENAEPLTPTVQGLQRLYLKPPNNY